MTHCCCCCCCWLPGNFIVHYAETITVIFVSLDLSYPVPQTHRDWNGGTFIQLPCEISAHRKLWWQMLCRGLVALDQWHNYCLIRLSQQLLQLVFCVRINTGQHTGPPCHWPSHLLFMRSRIWYAELEPEFQSRAWNSKAKALLVLLGWLTIWRTDITSFQENVIEKSYVLVFIVLIWGVHHLDSR